jgi:catechol 2,3-dioxygenase-like lactoylglutathione lyase family enzyme
LLEQILTGRDPRAIEFLEAHADLVLRRWCPERRARHRVDAPDDPPGGPMKRELAPEKQIRPAKFAHFVLRTRNLEESIAWYQTLLGMQVVHRNDFIAFLTYDDEHHRLALVKTPVTAPTTPGAPGLDHVAYTFETLGELLSTYCRLKQKGILPVWPINHGPTTSLYYADPDGNRVELQIDNFATEAELKGWMQSGAFAANPIGVVFDPDALVARYTRGDSLDELVKQGAA